MVDRQRRDDEKNNAIGWADRRLQHVPFVILNDAQILPGLYSILHRNRGIPETFVFATQPKEPFEKCARRDFRSITRNHFQVAHQSVEPIRMAADILGRPDSLSASFSQDGRNACN